MLTWSEQYATGVPLVDTQHRMLIEKINALESQLAGPTPTKGQCDILINFLANYVDTHFRYEESCMARNHCPAHAQNQTAHAAFLNVIKKFKARYQQEGPSSELLQQLQQSSADWITHHILTIDIQLKDCAK